MILILSIDLNQFDDIKYLQQIIFEHQPQYLQLPTEDIYWKNIFTVQFLQQKGDYSIRFQCINDVEIQEVIIISENPSEYIFCKTQQKKVTLKMIDLIFKDCNDNINYLRGQICIFSGALFDCVSEKNQEIEFLIEETFTIVYISQSSKSQKTFFKAQLEVNGVIRSLMEFGTTGIFNFTLKADLMSIEKVNNSPNYAYFLVKDYELQMGFIGVSIEQCGYFGIYDNDDCKFESWRHFPQFLIFTVTNKDEIIYFYNSNKNGNIVKLVGTTDVTVQTLVEGVGENVILVRFGISLGFETSQCMNLLPEMDLWLQLDGNMFWLRNKQQVTCRFDEMCVALDTSFSDSC